MPASARVQDKPQVLPANMLPEHARLLDEAIAGALADQLRPYQLDWFADTGRYKSLLACRQVGKSYVCVGLDALLHAFQPRLSPKHASIIVSAADASAQEVMVAVTHWADIIDGFTRKLGLGTIYTTPPTGHSVNLFNGGRVFCLSSNPRTIAGYTGDVWWDEAAKTRHDKLVWEAVFGIIRSNPRYCLAMTSSAWGDDNVFYEKHEKDAATDGGLWHRHRCDIYQAQAQGIFTQQDVDEIRVGAGQALFEQDYECKFLATENQAIPPEVLTALQMLPLPEYRDQFGRDLPGVRRCIGVDVGRTNDLFAVCWIVEYPRGMFRIENVLTRRKCRFADQRAILRSILGYGRGGTAAIEGVDLARMYVHAAAIDAKGLGMDLAETIKEEFPAVVDCVQWSSQSKERCISGMIAAMSTGHVQVEPRFSSLLGALKALRRELLPGGLTRYDAAHTDEGHADEAVGLALALERLKGSTGDWGLADDVTADVDTSGMPGAGIVAALNRQAKRAQQAPDNPLSPLAHGATDYDEAELREFRRMAEEGSAEEPE